MKKAYLSNIFTLQFLGIFLVVLGHSIPDKNMPYFFHVLFRWIYSFHMPLFFSISGYLYKYGLPKYLSMGGKYFFINKFNRLIIPFIFLNLITVPMKIIGKSFVYRDVGNNVIDYLSSFLYIENIPIGNLWFIIVLFHIFIIFFFLLPRGLEYRPLPVIVTFLLLYWMSVYLKNEYPIYNFLGIETSISNLLYFYIGMLIFQTKSEKKWNIIWSVYGYLFILLYVFYFGNNFFDPFVAIIGILSSFCLASHFKIYHTPFAVIARYSYQIYLLSWFPQVFVRIILSDQPVIWLPYSLIVFISFLLGILIPLFITKIMQITRLRKLGTLVLGL